MTHVQITIIQPMQEINVKIKDICTSNSCDKIKYSHTNTFRRQSTVTLPMLICSSYVDRLDLVEQVNLYSHSCGHGRPCSHTPVIQWMLMKVKKNESF